MALDLDGTRSYCALPAFGASGNWLHAHRHTIRAARAARDRGRGIHGRVHVDHRDSTELGRVVFGCRLLSPVHQA